jgi:hypothetical protein
MNRIKIFAFLLLFSVFATKMFANIKLAGALWYQGESNSPTASIYRDLMETLILDWRKQWNQGDFPFIYVQLANIGKEFETVPAAHCQSCRSSLWLG